ncbi:MAG: beta-eliminating lyase-related protein [Christensenellales bacterium]
MRCTRMSTWFAPRLLYVSQPTEIGTVYHLDELKALREVCDRLGLILFVDGARLGSALTSPECDMTLKDLAALADCFYIGGTKNGLLFGEAMVIVNPALQKDFRYMIKHNGGMIARGTARRRDVFGGTGARRLFRVGEACQ